jgi:hypothetical protein
MLKLFFTLFVSIILIFLPSNLYWQESGSQNFQEIKSFSWEGEYLFSENAGDPESSGYASVIHDIKIYKKNGKLFAFISADGNQTFERLSCRAKVIKNKISFYLIKSERKESLFNSFKGESLFSLERVQTNKEYKIITYWDLYEPIIIEVKENGCVCFEKKK